MHSKVIDYNKYPKELFYKLGNINQVAENEFKIEY